MNENKTQGAFDDLKNVFNRNESILDNDGNSNCDSIIIITKNWLPIWKSSIIWCILMAIGYEPKYTMGDFFMATVIFYFPIFLLQYWDISGTKITIDINKKEAFYYNRYYKSSVKEITAISISRMPIIESFNKLIIAGKGDGNRMVVSKINNYWEVEKFVKKFNL